MSTEYFDTANKYDVLLENLQQEIESEERSIYSGNKYFGGAAFISFKTEDMK